MLQTLVDWAAKEAADNGRSFERTHYVHYLQAQRAWLNVERHARRATRGPLFARAMKRARSHAQTDLVRAIYHRAWLKAQSVR
ncbi:MAG: hypothetical protein KGI89_03145 [Euryarchaeota archaeon]|nr:hypothetical protein [Euryarchaeota archaeon]